MKTLTVFVLTVVLSWFSFGQTLTVHKTDQTTVSIPLSQIDSITFTSGSPGIPCPGTPTVSWGGRTYNTVEIGTQCWMRENLDIGTMVQASQNQTNNSVMEKYCYDNNPVNCATYGGLYQWDETIQYDTAQGPQGLCPPGWHIPMLAEFQTLSATVGGDGNALKAIGLGSGGGAGTNTSGFSALFAGFRDLNGYFFNLGFYASFWSSTRFDAPNAHSLNLYPLNATINLDGNIKVNGYSVRCLKD